MGREWEQEVGDGGESGAGPLLHSRKGRGAEQRGGFSWDLKRIGEEGPYHQGKDRIQKSQYGKSLLIRAPLTMMPSGRGSGRVCSPTRPQLWSIG